MKYLIAEIGNNHQGNMDEAKSMAKEALESGANIVKFQAIKAETVKGSMNKSFYKKCELTIKQYKDLAEYCKDIGIIPMFSVFDSSLEELFFHGYKKIAAMQTDDLLLEPFFIKKNDKDHVFISFHGPLQFELSQAKCMVATIYCADDYNFDFYETLNSLKKNCNFYGISDHCLTINPLIREIKANGINVVEKHFISKKLKNNIYYNGQKFRDSIHSATPCEFELIAKALL